jgi:hypothetical protein
VVRSKYLLSRESNTYFRRSANLALHPGRTAAIPASPQRAIAKHTRGSTAMMCYLVTSTDSDPAAKLSVHDATTPRSPCGNYGRIKVIHVRPKVQKPPPTTSRRLANDEGIQPTSISGSSRASTPLMRPPQRCTPLVSHPGNLGALPLEQLNADP